MGGRLALLGLVLGALVLSADGAHAACTRDDFSNVVDEAAATLRDVNAQNTPGFQGKLRQLKERRGWSHDQFMREGAIYVRDERIAEFEDRSNTLLTRITSLGEGGTGKEPDCKLLDQLKGLMAALVQTTQAKWAYMNSKIDRSLTQPN